MSVIPLDNQGNGERVPLGAFPTPLEPLDRLTEHLGGPRVWAKRDDYSGLAGGGNKVRKLEFLLADALRQGADVVLTCGAVQSNHARVTAAACSRLGLACELWLNRRVPDRQGSYELSGNLLLDRLLDARIELLPGDVDAELAAEQRTVELTGMGLRPYLIPTGGSNALGARAYVDCAQELLDQADRAGVSPGTIVVPMGSGGTLAGLSAGLGMAGWTGRLLGIAVSATPWERVAALAGETASALGQPGSVREFELDDGFVGPGYGVPTVDGIDAIRLLARLEGMLLDPVYTGKTMAALIAHVLSGALSSDEDVLFLHTGGWPALFAYLEDL
jgi:L-cysteate sulfo-lyase